MKKILWIGMITSEEQLRRMTELGYSQTSLVTAQSNLINGIEINDDYKLDIISGFNYPPYPKYKLLRIRDFYWKHNDYTSDVNVGFLNIKYISHVFKIKRLIHHAKHWIRTNQNKDDSVVLIYSMHSPFLAVGNYIKKLLPKAKIILIVPDLPQYMDLSMGMVKKVLKKIDWIIIKRMLGSIDGYVFFSKHMEEFVKSKNKPWIVMEGTINKEEFNNHNISNGHSNVEKISIMYSGLVDLKYGIPELINAFKSLKDNRYELWISGIGNAVDFVKKMSRIDDRIKYLGFFSTRKELLQKQKEATMLINMRLPVEASAYCFPSKLFEYMASGNPVLTFKIKGIPDEYFDYLILMKSTSAVDICEAIEQVADMNSTNRKEFGNRAREFLLNNKNSEIQAKKIINFIEEI